jgi:hypothetical protein
LECSDSAAIIPAAAGAGLVLARLRAKRGRVSGYWVSGRLLATSSKNDFRVTVALGGDGEIALQGGCERVLLSGAEHSIDAQALELWTVHTYLNRAVSVHFGDGFAQR